MENHVTPKKTVAHRVARQNHNEYDDNNSNDSAPQTKSVVGKKTSIPVTWNGSTVSTLGQKST